ncbi:unnamed protein product [Schistocephalus solidus]|uniref:ABC transporter ATP-binding protein n=1 Tax=Schistocephalus solidus TaxID=70667 RepID=A0A183TNI8_SCHSO|nr:unnamed protein product [Schistocephalus solidus]
MWVGPDVVNRVLSDTTCLIHHQDRPYSEEVSVHFKHLKPGYPVGENADHLEVQAGASHQEDTQLVEHYLEIPPEGGYALHEVFSDEQQV